MLLVFVCIAFETFTFAQTSEKKITQRSVIWLGYFNTVIISPKWSVTSDISERFFTDNGKHARFAIGVNALPLNACVELELTVEIQ